jgi:hypothetical protein
VRCQLACRKQIWGRGRQVKRTRLEVTLHKAIDLQLVDSVPGLFANSVVFIFHVLGISQSRDVWRLLGQMSIEGVGRQRWGRMDTLRWNRAAWLKVRERR